MKNSFYKFAIAVAWLPFLVGGCEKDDEATLSLSADELSFEAAGNPPQTITVKAGNVAWNASVVNGEGVSGAEPWISVEQTSGSVTVTVADNPETASRTGIILIKPGSSSLGDKAVVVIQKGRSEAPFLDVEPAGLFFLAENNRPQYAYVTARETEWKIEVEEAARSWLEATTEYEKSRLVVTAVNNPSAGTRQGKVRIFGSGGSPEAVLTVTQDPAQPVLKLDRTIAIFTDSQPAAQTIAVTANLEWNAEAQEGDDWYDVEVSDASLAVIARDMGQGNSVRRGKITVSGSGEATVPDVVVDVVQGPSEKIEFVAGRICYYANEYENGTASYSVQLLSGNGYWADNGENITNGWHAQIKTVGPGPEPPYDEFALPAGTYVSSTGHEPYTFVPTYNSGGLTMGSTIYRFNNMPIPGLVTGLKEGYITVEREGEIYTISILGITKEDLVIDGIFSDTMFYLDFSANFPGYD